MPRRWGPTTVLLMYVAVTVALWCIAYFTENCWNWENAHLSGDLSRRDRCLAIWWPSTLILIAMQLGALVCAVVAWRTGERTLPWGWRIAAMVFALVVLVTNTLIKILLFAPAIH